MEFRRSHAIIIGINDYRNGIPKLATAVDDATRLATVLQTSHGYTVQLLIEDVTRERLIACFSQTLPAQMGQDDRLLVYFAGHGIALDGDDGPQGYLIPQDASPETSDSFLAMTDVHRWLAALPCRHLLTILDCCFAGAFRWASTRHLQPLPDKLYQERYDRFLRDPAWQVLTSAAYDQKALDVLAGSVVGERGITSVADQSHSPFALALFAALAGAGDVSPRAAGDGVITATELYLYLRDAVEVQADRAFHRQTPGLWPLTKHDKGEYIFLVPGHVVNLEPAPPLTAANNPYRGLKAYEEKDAQLFFGRTALIKQLTAQVLAWPLTLVLGASGTGKSSLVKAGLLPSIRNLAADEGEDVDVWHILPLMRPGDHPLHTLGRLLQDEFIGNDVAPMHAMADWLASHPAQHLLLVIDQFEEVITLCREETERQAFLALLTELVQAFPERLRLVVTLRSDFEPQFVNTPFADRQSLLATRFIVPPMSQDELRTVIEQPAAVQVLYFDPPALVDDLINEVVQTPGALPLLSFTLEQLYLKYLVRQSVAQRAGVTIERSLTAADYAALGGVIGSLRTRADEEYAQLPDDAYRATMQRVMLRMIALEGSEVTRRVRLSELDYPNSAENMRVETVIQRLVDARLLVRGGADIDGDGVEDPYIEPAHSALVQAWDKLLLWRQQATDYLPLQRRLTPIADEWAQATGAAQAGLLWNNNPRLPQLQQVLMGERAATPRLSGWGTTIYAALFPPALVRADPTWLNTVESAFVQASVVRRAGVLRRIIGITTVVIIVLAGLTLLAEINRRNAVAAEGTAVAEAAARATQEAIAIAQRDVALSRELAALAAGQIAVDPESAILVALEANTITRTYQSEAVLRSAVHASPLRAKVGTDRLKVQSAAFAPDGHSLFMIGLEDNEPVAQLLAFPSLEPLWTIQSTASQVIYTSGFSPQGTYVWASDYETIYIWDARSGKEVMVSPAQGIGWFPDESAMVMVNPQPDSLLQLWDLQQGQIVTTLGTPSDAMSYDYVVHVTPDQQQVMLLSLQDDYVVQVWEIETGRQITEFVVDPSFSFSPDGSLMAYGEDEHVILRDTLTQQVIFTYTQHTADVYQTQFSPNGRELASAGNDNKVQLWTVADSGAKAALIPATFVQGSRVDAMAFAPDQPLFLTLNGATVRGWSTQSTGSATMTLAADQERIQKLAFAPQGGHFITIAADGALRVWSENVGEEWARIPAPLQLQTSGIAAAHLSPDGRRVAVSADSTVKLFDLETRTWLSTSLTMTEHVDGFAFTPDGTQIVVHGEKQIAWWDMASARQLGAIAVISDSIGMAILASDGQSGAAILRVREALTESMGQILYQVVMWDTASGQWRPLLGDLARYRAIDTLRFSPDSKELLVVGVTALSEAGANHHVVVWDVATGAARFQLDFGPETAVGYTPDGQKLLVVGPDEISLRNAQDGNPIIATSTISRPVSAAAMSFSGDGSRVILPDSYSSTARVWDVDTLQPIFSLVGHVAGTEITAAQFSQDGQLILTANARDGTARLWNGKTGTLLTTLDYAQNLALSMDGRFVFSQTGSVLQIYLARFDELFELAKARVTRDLTCEERRDFLHEARECPVATPLPRAD